MASQMKGLTQFIADIRITRSHEAERSRVNEELANIRQKFRDPKLDNYSRRKYVAKLIYIYMLGYEVELGQAEALALISNSKFSEKQVGYLALGLLLNENSRAVEQAMPTVYRDLASINDLDTSLALNYLSTLHELNEQAVPEVYKILISPTSSGAARKKAALVLRSMYLHDSSIIASSWTDRIVALLDDPDVGVATSASALIKAIATESPESMAQAYPAAIRRLETIYYKKEYTPEHVYYNVPMPWFTVKLLEIIELYPVSSADQLLESLLGKVLRRMVDWITDDIALGNEPQQHQNARNAVFFEVINVLAHVNSGPDLIKKVVGPLSDFLRGNLVSYRFLALDALRSLADVPAVQAMLDDVLRCVRDRDITVRKKSLDVLYHLCNGGNVEHVAADLLDQLPFVDFVVRKDMVTMLAAVTEKYATSHKWYVDTSLSLLMIGGQHVSDEVRHRLIQIVVNNENIQGYTARAVMDYLSNRKSASSENLIMAGAYVLGEYGHLITREPGCSPTEQFIVLQDRIDDLAPRGKQTLLTSYIKQARKFREIQPRVVEVFEHYARSSNVELQQRSVEYLNFLEPKNAQLLETAWEDAPPFAENEGLLAHLGKSKPALMRQNTGLSRQASQLKRPGGFKQKALPVRPPLETARTASFDRRSNASPAPPLSAASSGGFSFNNGPPQPPPSRSAGSAGSATSVPQLQSLPGPLGPLAPPLQPQPLKAANTASSQNSFNSNSGSNINSGRDLTPSATGASTGAKETLLSSNWEHGFRFTLTHKEATLYRDALLQVGSKYEFKKSVGYVILYFKNLSAATITSFSSQIANPMGDQVLMIKSKSLPPSNIAPGEVVEQTILCEAKQPFAVSPTIKISYVAGAYSDMHIRLPIVIERFMEATTLPVKDFLQRWNQIGPDGEFQRSFRNFSTSKQAAVVASDYETLTGLNYGIADMTQLQTKAVFAAGILHTSDAGNFGCLMKVDADPSRENIKVTARSTKKLVAVVLTKNLSNAYLL